MFSTKSGFICQVVHSSPGGLQHSTENTMTEYIPCVELKVILTETLQPLVEKKSDGFTSSAVCSFCTPVVSSLRTHIEGQTVYLLSIC